MLGFLLRYCDTALSKVSGTDEPLQDGAMRVFRQLGNIDRFRELFGGKLPDDRLPDPDSNEVGADVERGRICATIVLTAFAVNTELGHGDEAPEAMHAEAAALPLPINAPETRLHPAGPTAELGQRLLMEVFATRLAKLASQSN